MKIKSFASIHVFWRAFDTNDVTYAVGLEEGIIPPGQEAQFSHPRDRSLKVELKERDAHGALIMPAGRVFANRDGIEVHNTHFIAQTHIFLRAL